MELSLGINSRYNKKKSEQMFMFQILNIKDHERNANNQHLFPVDSNYKKK